MAELTTTTERRAAAWAAPRLWSRVAWIGGAFGVAALFLWLTIQCRPFTIDDAFISFRYAENLVRGNGLVFNPGERVEGYTNFLWVLIIAAVQALGGESLAWAKLLSTAANVFTLGLVTWAATRWWPRPAFPGLALLPALLLAVNFGFVLWGVGGLETALFTALVTAGLLRLVHECGIWNAERGIDDKHLPAAQGEPARVSGILLRIPRSAFGFPYSALLFALATLARPDGAVLFAGGMVGWGLWALLTRQVGVALVRRWLAGGLLYGAIVGAQYLFRYFYYGDWVPNTAYIKVPQDGFVVHWQALVTWLRPWGLVDPSNLAPLSRLLSAWPDWWTWAVSLLATPSLLLVLIGLGAGRRHAWAWVLGGAGAVWLIYLARVFDDWMPGWRFYVPIVPATTLLLAAGFNRLAAAVRRLHLPWRGLFATVLAGALVAMVWLSLAEARSEFGVVQGHADIQAHYRAAGEYLRAHAPPGSTLAVIDAGAIPYYADLFTIDYGGLADIHMARQPFQSVTLDKGDGVLRHYVLRADPAYLLGRRPDFVQLSGHIEPDGHWVGHLPELALVYQAMVQAGTYDLAHPVLVDDPVQLIIVRRIGAGWNP